MALQTLNTIKQWFKTGLKPTQTQFWDTWDSFRHKFDKIPVKEVEGLDELLLSKADKTALDSHIADKNAHAPQVNTDWNSESGFSQLLNKPEFKTINGEPLTGGGNIIIEAGGSQNLQTTLANGNETTNSIIFNDDYYNWLKTSIDSRSIRLTDSNSDMLVAIDSAGVVTRDDSQHVSLNPQGIFFNRDTADTAESYLRINESSTGVSTVNLPVTKGKEITLAATDDFKTINGESIVGEGNLDIEPRGLKSVLDADPTASYGQSKATVMGDYGNSKYNELIVSDETEKTGIYQLKNQLSFDHTVLDSNDIGNITLSEGNVILTRDKSNNQTVVDISDPVANTQLRFPAKSEEGKTYTIATTEDFKTINGESIVGSGDILISGGAGDIPTLQEVLDKDRNATNASINLLSEDEESQTTVHEGGLNISAKAETGFLITDINKLGVSVSKDEETTFVNVLADELSLNKNLSGNPVKQGIVLNEESSGASTIKLPLTSDGNVKTLATTEDFKTINGESIVGEGDIVISGTTLWKAGTVSTSITTVDGDNEASGTKSIAIGHQTAASGYASYAEGSFTQSSGNNSHAEGNETTSSSSASHSEGYQTSAQGPYSHAEGQATKAFGTGSHSEGYQTIAQGIYSHAEGKQTTALGDYSHAEGNLTIALGENSHAGGNESEANGLYSFVHGNNSFANNENTIVLGANITGIESDTTYVDKLNIKSVPAGTLDRSLGIDVDGNVIAGNVGGVGSQTFDQILDAGNTAIGKTMVLNYPNEATSTLNGFNISVDNQRGNSVTTSPNIISVESRNQNKRISILSDQIEFYNSLNESDKVRLASRGIEPNATGTIYLPTLKTGPNSRTLAATDDFKTINGQSILGEGNIYITGDQGLDQVLSRGNVSEKVIFITDGDYKTTLGRGAIKLDGLYNNEASTITPNSVNLQRQEVNIELKASSDIAGSYIQTLQSKSGIIATTDDLTPYALDANVVHKTGTEDLHGRKRFFSDNTESGGIDIYGSVFNGGKMLNISPGSGANSSGIGITVSGGARGIEVDASSEAGDAIFVQARSGSAAFVANGGTGFSGNLFLGTNNGSTTSSIDKLGNGFFNGNVGIGISKPLSVGGGSKWLTIDGTTSYGGGFISSINGVGKGFYYYDNGFAKVQADGGSGIRLVVGGTNALTVLPNGNTLVGTTTDNEAKFQVNGTISTTGIVSNYIANNALVVYNSMTNYTSLNTFGDSENVAGNVGFYSLESLRYNSTDGVQKITYINGANAGKLYVRVKSEGTWSAWVEK